MNGGIDYTDMWVLSGRAISSFERGMCMYRRNRYRAVRFHGGQEGGEVYIWREGGWYRVGPTVRPRFQADAP